MRFTLSESETPSWLDEPRRETNGGPRDRLVVLSYVFDINDETVWSPSLRVGDLYVRMLQDVGSVLGVATGLSAVSSDMWDIDIDAFENLVRLMHETYFESVNQVFKVLIEGVLAPSIVILERGGKKIHPETGEQRAFHDRAHGLSMAR